MLEDEVRSLVADHSAGDGPGEWNRAGLQTRLSTMVPTIAPAALAAVDEATDVNALTETLVDAVAEAYEGKRRETGEEGIGVLERIVLLRVIDSLWVEHLTAVDDMRRGIGLRAYSQRDPLNEFKVEAYRMFDELKSTIRNDVSNTIFRVNVAREPVAQQPRRVVEGRIDLATGAVAADSAALAGNGNGAAASGGAQPVKAGPKIGRNDPCWCGSGKKYKRCHGA
jgi:preprotein translocase subunit SecA